MNLNKYFFLIFFFLIASVKVYAAQQPLILSDTGEKYLIGRYMEILEDPDGSLSIEDVMSQNYAERFENCRVDVKNLGYTRSVYWLKFTVKNDTTTPYWVLDFDYPLIDDIQVYDPDYSGKVIVGHGGRYHPVESNNYRYKNFSFNLQLSALSERQYYIRVHSEDSLPLPISIVSPIRFYSKNSLTNFAFGLFFGSLIIMLFYNIFIFTSTKDINSIYLIFLIFFVHLLFHLVLSGFGAKLFTSTSIWWSRNLIPVFEVIGVLFAIIFTKSFLATSKKTPKINFLLNINAIILLILLCLIPFIQYFYAIITAVLITMCAALLMWVAGFLCMIQGNKSARYYVIGFSALEIFGMLYGLKTLGIMPSNFYTENCFAAGAALHSLFFLIAIADSFNQLVIKRELARQAMVESEKKHRMIADNIQDVIYVFDFQNMELTYASPSVESLYGYTPEEFTALTLESLLPNDVLKKALAMLDEEISLEKNGRKRKRGPRQLEYEAAKKDGTKIYIETVLNFMRDENEKAIAIIGSARDISGRKKAENEIIKINSELEQRVEDRTEELNVTLEKVESVNFQIISGIKYAGILQSAMLPTLETFQKFTPDIFILWQPRDHVGGDFYYIDKIEGGYILAVADCTGHGVPGAFLTIMSTSELKKIVRGDFCYDPAEILKRLDTGIKKALKQDSASAVSDDGLDISICAVFPDRKEIIFSGARNPLIIARNGEIKTIKGDKKIIGYVPNPKKDASFTNHSIPISSDMRFYMFTDGYPDQPDSNLKRFGSKRLRETINKASTLPFDQQRTFFDDVHKKFRHGRERVDDITLIGFRMPDI